MDISIKSESNGLSISRLFGSVDITDNSDTMADRAYEYVLTSLIFPENGCDIYFGKKITESEIARELGMSNGPVREAMFRLRQEGWIETISGQGSFVTNLLDQAIYKDIYQYRTIIEIGSFEILFDNITDLQIRELERLAFKMEYCRSNNQVYEYRQGDIEFHLCAISFAGGESLVRAYRPKFLQSIALSIYLLNQSKADSDKWLTAPSSSHVPIVQCLQAKDKHELTKCLKSHIGSMERWVSKVKK